MTDIRLLEFPSPRGLLVSFTRKGSRAGAAGALPCFSLFVVGISADLLSSHCECFATVEPS